MTTTEGQAIARKCAQDRLSDLGMNLADLARKSGVDVKTIRSFLEGERWPQQKSRSAISDGLSWPAAFIDRLAEGTLDPEFALGHLMLGDEHGLYPSPDEGLALRLNGIDRQIDWLWARVESLEQRIQKGGEADGNAAATSEQGVSPEINQLDAEVTARGASRRTQRRGAPE